MVEKHDASLLPDSSSPSSIARSRSVISTVGNQAVLPCNWKSRLGEEAPPTCHIQWTTPADTVFELRGEHKWQAEEFEGRVEVPEESLGSGDCSLIISDVQIGDAGRYESFMVVDGVKSTKTRVFIQSVKLSVFGPFYPLSYFLCSSSSSFPRLDPSLLSSRLFSRLLFLSFLFVVLVLCRQLRHHVPMLSVRLSGFQFPSFLHSTFNLFSYNLISLFPHYY